jgi:hypothetical protein
VPAEKDFVHGDFTFADVEGNAMLRTDLCCTGADVCHYTADCQPLSRR